MTTKKNFLKELLCTVNEHPHLGYKALLILINLSNNKKIANLLGEVQAVKNLI